MATPCPGRRPAFRRGEKVRRPCVECGAFLLCPIIPVAVGRPNAAITLRRGAQVLRRGLRRFSDAAATSREGRRSPRASLEVLHQQWGRGSGNGSLNHPSGAGRCNGCCLPQTVITAKSTAQRPAPCALFLSSSPTTRATARTKATASAEKRPGAPA
jgi:hypothetical protein